MTSGGNSFSDSLQNQITKFRRTALPVIFTLRHLKKNQFLTNVFQEGSCFHLPMEWTHLYISMNFIQVYVNFEVKIASENLNILVRTYLTEKNDDNLLSNC